MKQIKLRRFRRLLVVVPLALALFLGSVVSVSAANWGDSVSSKGVVINHPFFYADTRSIGTLKTSQLDEAALEFLKDWQSDDRFTCFYGGFIYFFKMVPLVSNAKILSYRAPSDSGFIVDLKQGSFKLYYLSFYTGTTRAGEPYRPGTPTLNSSYIGSLSDTYLSLQAGTLLSAHALDKYGPSGVDWRTTNYQWEPWKSSGFQPINFLFDKPLNPSVSYNLSVNYQYADGTQAAPTHTESIAEGTAYSVASPALEGYTADKPTVSGTMGTEDITETVTYTRLPQPHTLTVNYIKEDNSKAAEPHTETVIEGNGYNVPSPEIEGYFPDKLTVTGTMGNVDVTETVLYTKNPPPIVDHTLTINYIYSDGSQAAETYVALLSKGEQYSVKSPVVEGYETDRKIVLGLMGEKDITVTVIYTADVPIVKHTLTIHYKYKNGTQALPDYTSDLVEGQSYTVASPAVTGYQADRAAISGNMGSVDVMETVVYTPKAVSVEPVLTVTYLFDNGGSAAPAYRQSLSYGSSYWIPSPNVSGYTPSRRIVFGSMDKTDVTIQVTYTLGSGFGTSGGIDFNPFPGGGIIFNPSGGGGVNFNPIP